MCGSSDAPEVEQTPQEIQAAKAAVAKYNEFHQDGYVGLEKAAIADSRIDHSRSLKGLAAADLAQTETVGYQAANNNRSGMGFTSLGNAIGNTLGTLNTSAEQQGLQIMDRKKVGAARTGQDLANTASGSLMASARNGLSKAMVETESTIKEQIARNKAIADVASSAMSIGGDMMAKNKLKQQKLVADGGVEIVEARPTYVRGRP
ncbi:hypothetical protein [Endozoicomonas ascidiicola]|uniref:hypothetical protein n=1 Tax=Endozoicomonas ascidiicola TaxID=1698521 RepID=UPI00082BB7E1|nr:hypothetical protein [Endozoicomonas ascidiicola]